MTKKKIKILMASAEVAPFAKVGGLADVVGSLPPALKKLGVDVRLIMPLYGSINRKKYKLKKAYNDLEVPSGMRFIKVNIWRSKLPGTTVPIYFIDTPKFFKSKHIYVPGDNSKRFLFFSLATLYAAPVIAAKAGQVKFKPDIIHCQDSHVALVPNILKATNLQFLKGVKTLYTIHNFQYQGKTKPAILSTGNLSKNSLKSLTVDAQDGDINFMVQGVLNADLINSVSKTYAHEITTSDYGAGLDNIIRKRKRDLFGIVNGIDINFFNPAKDQFIKQKYSTKSIGKKIINKIYLQKKLGLTKNKNIPLVGMITRLAWQKGIELITEKLIRESDCQFVFLGTGQKKYEAYLKKLARKYPDKVSGQIMFDIKLAQQIYAASDIFLMPSRFEPCGLGQMIAMRYGAVPVVRATGGLADTVNPQVGFSFKKFSAKALYRALQRAINIYYQQPKKWRALQISGMKKDFSWNKSAKEYLRLYKKLVK